MSQALIKRKDGMGRIGVFELLLNNNAVKNNIKKREIDQIQNIIETSSQQGMITSRQYAKKLLEKALVNSYDIELLFNTKML